MENLGNLDASFGVTLFCIMTVSNKIDPMAIVNDDYLSLTN
jgi:hypothetical protein